MHMPGPPQPHNHSVLAYLTASPVTQLTLVVLIDWKPSSLRSFMHHTTQVHTEFTWQAGNVWVGCPNINIVCMCVCFCVWEVPSCCTWSITHTALREIILIYREKLGPDKIWLLMGLCFCVCCVLGTWSTSLCPPTPVRTTTLRRVPTTLTLR